LTPCRSVGAVSFLSPAGSGRPATELFHHNPRSPVVVVVVGSVVDGSVVVVSGSVVVVVGGDVVVVGAVVVVTAGCVVVVAVARVVGTVERVVGTVARVVGVVVDEGKTTDWGSVEIFGDFVLGGTVVVEDFLGEAVVELVVVAAAAGFAVVEVLVASVVDGGAAARSSTVWPCTLTG
jgi:hypothetical protein